MKAFCTITARTPSSSSCSCSPSSSPAAVTPQKRHKWEVSVVISIPSYIPSSRLTAFLLLRRLLDSPSPSPPSSVVLALGAAAPLVFRSSSALSAMLPIILAAFLLGTASLTSVQRSGVMMLGPPPPSPAAMVRIRAFFNSAIWRGWGWGGREKESVKGS